MTPLVGEHDAVDAAVMAFGARGDSLGFPSGAEKGGEEERVANKQQPFPAARAEQR
jgi:hypothetical protein